MLGSVWSWVSGSRKQEADAELIAAHKSRVVEHNTRNFWKGGYGVLATGSATVLAAVLCRRSVVARRYIPRRFDSNVLPPKFNPMKDAARAVVDATMLATSMTGLIVASAFWYFEAGSLPELGAVLTSRYSPERVLHADPESEKVEKDLSALFFSKPQK